MKSEIKANAKINLSLDILGKLPNGYHKVEMIMQSIPLSDTVTIETEDGEGIEIFCEKQGVPTDSRNSAYKAARIFMDKAGIKAHIKITIDKKIPAAAGMAGGSTDAAAVFKGLNNIFGEPLCDEELLTACTEVGADVPFCFMGGCALAEGIGEVLTPVLPLKDVHIVAAKPDFEVSTKWVYENFKTDNADKRPDTKEVLRAVACGNLTDLAKYTANVLESVTEKNILL